MDDSENTNKFFEKPKKKKTMEFELDQIDDSETSKYFYSNSYTFGFDGNPSTPWNKDYFMYGELFARKDHIGIILKTDDNHFRQRKIGEIVEEMDEPSDLIDLFENAQNSVTFTF